MLSSHIMRIRDPIHGTIPVAAAEVPVIDSRFFQRLRHVKQLGFGEMAFPGATHSRHAHCIGAMHVVTRLFDSVFSHVTMPEADRARLRRAVRMAMLCHDLGHMPLSHSSERIAPPRAALNLPAWLPGRANESRGTHEDYTAKILLDSSLTPVLEQSLAEVGLTPSAIVALFLGGEPPGEAPFTVAGKDYAPLLRQLVSGELDADRMDYLQRDSFYTGVAYGRFDLDWLVSNLVPIERSGKVYLALAKAAIFAFEDFLLSRYHMFVSVYFHHTSVNFDQMLHRFYLEEPGSFVIPVEPERLLDCDDVSLFTALRASSNRWARRIVERHPYKLILQATELDRNYDLPALGRSLEAAGVDHFRCESVSVLSRYKEGGPPLYVLDPHASSITPIAEYTPLYQRYAGELRLSRIYCVPERAAEARMLVARGLRGAHG